MNKDRIDDFIEICVDWFLKSDTRHLDQTKLKDKQWLQNFFQARKTVLENNEIAEFNSLSNMDKLAQELEKIPGASLWNKNPKSKDSFDFIELKIYDSNEIDQVYELLEKYDFNVVSENDSFGTDYAAYIINIKPKQLVEEKSI